MRIFRFVSRLAEVSFLLESGDMSLGNWCSTFRDREAVSKRRASITQWHGATFQKTGDLIKCSYYMLEKRKLSAKFSSKVYSGIFSIAGRIILKWICVRGLQCKGVAFGRLTG